MFLYILEYAGDYDEGNFVFSVWTDPVGGLNALAEAMFQKGNWRPQNYGLYVMEADKETDNVPITPIVVYDKKKKEPPSMNVSHLGPLEQEAANIINAINFNILNTIGKKIYPQTTRPDFVYRLFTFGNT